MIERQHVWQRIRDERLNAGRDTDKPAGTIRREISRAHDILGTDGIGFLILD
jgi:hypothetical protein